MGIRRRFSSLSGNANPIPSSSTSISQNRSKTPAAPNSTPSLLINQNQTKTTKIADENGNNLNAEENKGEGVGEDGFDVASNLEAFKQRCRALEAENRRLMSNQGKIIQDSNRRLDTHLEEIRQLNEAMEHQKRENVELVRWAQRLEGESTKAKELAREWQRIGQSNNRLVQREFQCFQTRMEQLELKCAKLTGENVELKRLCLYLDKQRQTLWQQLAQKNADENDGGEGNLMGQQEGERGECSSGCGSSAASTPSSSNSVNSLEGSANGGDGGKRGEEDADGGNLHSISTQIHVDGEQEKTLQSISSEMMQSSILLGQLEKQTNSEDGVSKNRHNAVSNGHLRRRIVSPKILDHFEGEEQFEQANLVKTLPPTVQFDKQCNMDNSALSEQSAIGSINTSSSSPCSSSFGTTAQFGSSFCSSSDDTAILVLDMDEHPQLLQNVSALHQHAFNADGHLNGLGGLEVRELCTISEEEGDDGEESVKLMKLDQLERMKLASGKGENDELKGGMLLEEMLIRRRTTGGQQLAAINAPTTANSSSISLSSSLLAQAGSMLASMMDDAQQQQQMSQSAANILMDQKEEAIVLNGAGGNNRNSSTSTGSSSSSGAFSGTSGGSGVEVFGRTRAEEGVREFGGTEDDDLPPEMPLISDSHHRLLLPSKPNNRPTSCLEATNAPTKNVVAIPSEALQQQRSTLPRTAGGGMMPPNGQSSSRPSSVIGQQQIQRPIHPPDYSSLNSRISPRPHKKMTLLVNGHPQPKMPSKGPPVRIRVRPPIMQTTNLQIPLEQKKKMANSLDHPQPFALNLSMPNVKGADVTSL